MDYIALRSTQEGTKPFVTTYPSAYRHTRICKQSWTQSNSALSAWDFVIVFIWWSLLRNVQPLWFYCLQWHFFPYCFIEYMVHRRHTQAQIFGLHRRGLKLPDGRQINSFVWVVWVHGMSKTKGISFKEYIKITVHLANVVRRRVY